MRKGSIYVHVAAVLVCISLYWGEGEWVQYATMGWSERVNVYIENGKKINNSNQLFHSNETLKEFFILFNIIGFKRNNICLPIYISDAIQFMIGDGGNSIQRKYYQVA